MLSPSKGDAVSFEPGYPVVNDEFTKSGKYNLTKVSHLSPRFIISPGKSCRIILQPSYQNARLFQQLFQFLMRRLAPSQVV